jgi:hypothetical protein
MLIVLILATSAPVITVAQTPVISNTTVVYSGDSSRIIYVFLPIDRLVNLVGFKVDSLLVAPCYDNNSISVPKMIPRKISATHMPSLNSTLLVPDLGDGVLNRDDILVISLPLPNKSLVNLASSCSWNIFAVKSGLRDRYLVTTSPDMIIFDGERLERLNTPLKFAIYFDKERAPHIRNIPYDFMIIRKLGQALGLNEPQKPLLHDTFSLEAKESATAWSNWLSNIRNKLNDISLSRYIEAIHEHREAFIYDPLSNQVLAELSDKGLETTIYKQTKDLYPTAAIIDGGGGPLRFYEFTLITLMTTRITSTREVNIYMGYNVYSSIIYLRANSSSSANSYLSVTVRIIDTDTKQVVWSNTYTYTLTSTPNDIYIYPYTPFDSTKRYNISISYAYSGGSYPYVIISTLIVHKVWDNMPTSQTSKGYQILSVGIAGLRSPYYPGLPLGCQRAKASDMLDPSVYGLSMKQGLVISYPITSVTIDSSLMNGLYYDSLYSTSPILYIDICIRNPNTNTYTGTVTVKINGVTYATRSVSAPPLPSWGYAGFTIFLGSNPAGGYGSLITIEHNFPSTIELYIDVLIEYLYAPETWKETNYATWAFSRFPMFKLLLHQDASTATLYESGIVVDARSFSETVQDNIIVVKHLVSSEKLPTPPKILGVDIALKHNVSTTQYNYGCNLKRTQGTVYDTYIGPVVTIWGIVSTGIEIATLLGLIPTPVSAGAFVTSLIISLLSMSKESISAYITSDGYIRCSWSPGINDYKYVELELFVNYYYLKSSVQFNIYVGANQGWLTRPISFTIPYYSRVQVSNSLDEGYMMFYGRLPGELIYD